MIKFEDLKEKLDDWYWHWIRNPIMFFFQRRIRGFDDSDLWGLDYSLAKLILPRLKAFREMKQYGCPEEFYDQKADSCKGWHEALDKMIFAFVHIADDYGDWETALHDKYVSNWRCPKGKGFLEHLNRKKSPEEKTDYKLLWEELDKVNDKIQEGLDLFGKYYRNLWD